MQKKINENEINYQNELKIDINDISTLLYKSGFLTYEINEEEILNILNSDTKNCITDIFEFNSSITIKEASSKYKDLIKSLNLLIKEDLKYNLESLYNQYLEYVESSMPLNDFLNCLIMLNYILTKFKEVLNLQENDDCKNIFQLDKKISIISIDKINESYEKDAISYKLERIYEKIENNPEYKENKVNKSIIILIYIISLDGQILVDKETTILTNLLQKLNLYNKIYISNIHLSLILYIQIVLFINMYINNSNKSKKNYVPNSKSRFQEFSRNEPIKNNKNSNFTFVKNNNLSKYSNKTQILSTNRKLNYNGKNSKIDTNESKNNVYNEDLLNFYLFKDELNKKKSIGNDETIILFQNYLKYFSFYILSKNKIQAEFNLSFESIDDFRNILLKNYYSQEENENIFNDINENVVNKLNINPYDILTKEDISTIFSSFNINELIIKFMDFGNKSQIEFITSKFIDIINKSNLCYFQEPVNSFIKNKKDEKTKSNKSVEYLTIKDLFTQFDILYFYLIFFHKHHEKKCITKSINIKFNAFKCIINHENKKIQIFFNYSLVKEKTLFHYLKHSCNILNLEEKYTDIITSLKEFKQYDSSIRLCQNNFRSNQVSFIFTLLTKIVINFVNENKLAQKITILETELNNFNPNLQVFIKDENMKLKNRIFLIKQMIYHQTFGNKFFVLLNYLESLSQIWNLIVISDNENEFKLLRTFEDNKLFFYISHDKTNTNINQNSMDNNINIDNNSTKSKKNLDIEYVNVIMYFKNDENIFSKGLSFIEELASDKDSILEYKFSLICDRFFLESNILMEPKMKKNVKIMYSLIDDLFMIAKNIKSDYEINENDENDQDNEYYNYDIYIADSFIAVANYHMYNMKEDEKYSRIIFEYLSILSSCIEFILYILKNKDIYIPKFIYLLRTNKDNYYMFEYKESNMFIKKVKEFNSLISLKTKDCYPLLCFLSKKEQTKYTISNDNFYDVFLRLFLNLNKVVDSKDKLNEVFLHKIHKNIFYEYYDSFILIAFSYEAINFFNDFLIKNEYLTITKGEKFDKCYIVLTEDIIQKKQNYKILLNNLKDENNTIIKKFIVFDFNFKASYFFVNKNYSFLGFHKAEFLINEEINQIKSKIIPDLNINLNAIYKIFKSKLNSKEQINKIVSRIKLFMIGDEKISIYNSNSKSYENILEEYIKEKNKMKAQKVEMRVYQLTEEAKNTQNSLDNKKNCIIF